MRLSATMKHRLAAAAGAFLAGFISAYLKSSGGIGVDVLAASGIAGVTALAHYLAVTLGAPA